MIEIKFKGDLKGVITEIVNFRDALNAPLNPNLDSAGASQNATPSAAVNSAANVVPAHEPSPQVTPAEAPAAPAPAVEKATPAPATEPITLESTPNTPEIPKATPDAPVAAVPVAPAKEYSLDELLTATAPLMDAGKIADLQALMQKYGVASMMEIPKEKYGELATDLRALGAKL
ncbi:hypothetical protein [uncultured Megasphaera sp.]|uniref:hypothetical protein n=1 Tax=uncultured Megasphaera sp. TaxID=165188 RepID=UPI002598F573|nr:hypothetical protein [uncultured Megasphaera sp.]